MATKRTAKKQVTELTVIKKGEVIPPLTDREPEKDAPIEVWVEWVGLSLSKTVESIIVTGRRLVKLRDNFKHGEWGKTVEERLHISQRTVNKLIEIGEHVVLADWSKWTNLPPAWTVIYAIVKAFPGQELKKKMDSGEINAGTSLKDIMRLKKGAKSVPITSGNPAEPNHRRSPPDEWNKFNDYLEQLGGEAKSLRSETLRKAKAGDTEQHEKAKENVDRFIEDLEKVIALVKKLEFEIRQQTEDMNKVSEHVPPRSRRKTKGGQNGKVATETK